MKPFEDKAHTTKRHKMGCITGSMDNFESPADKATRMCRGGYANGGMVVNREAKSDSEKKDQTRYGTIDTKNPSSYGKNQADFYVRNYGDR